MEEDDNMWECPVCLEKMHEIAFPISNIDSPCTHSFCIPCSHDLTNAAALKSQQLQCPVCRRNIQGFIINQIAISMLQELDKCKESLREAKDKEKDTHRRERKLAQDNNSASLRVAYLEGELAKAVSDRQCEVDRNEHLKKMCKLIEMEKETLSERLSDLQKKLQAELEDSSRRISIMENEVSEYQNQLRLSTEETAKSESENHELRASIRDTEERLEHVIEDKRALEARVIELQEQLASTAAEMKRVQAEHETVLEDVRARLANEVRRVQMEHEASQEELRSKLQNSQLFERRSKELEAKASLLEIEVRRAKEEMVKADRRALELDFTVKKSESERMGTGQVILQLEAMLGTYKEEVRTLEREKYEVTKKAAELEGTLARMKSDAMTYEEEKVGMKERAWKAERDMEVMRQERDKLRACLKERDEKQNDTYLSGWMKNLKPISNAIWGDQRVYGPLVKNVNDFVTLERRGGRKDGKVWRCKSKQTGTFYALKTTTRPIPQNAQGSADLAVFREAMLLCTMDHPSIITLEGLYKDVKGQLNMILSPFVEIDLDYSIGQRTMNAMEIKTLSYQLLLAINYMHKQDLVHRNIKPTNILRFEDYTLKLSGFTYARSVQNQTVDALIPKPPLWFTAPEVLKAQTSLKAQSAIDWKAAEMLLQKPLFAGSQDAFSNICQILDVESSSGNLYPSTSNNTLDNKLAGSPYASHPSFRTASALLRDLLVFDPTKRINAAKALQHEYFSELNTQKEVSRAQKDISREVQDSNLQRFVEFDCAGIL